MTFDTCAESEGYHVIYFRFIYLRDFRGICYGNLFLVFKWLLFISSSLESWSCRFKIMSNWAYNFISKWLLLLSGTDTRLSLGPRVCHGAPKYSLKYSPMLHIKTLFWKWPLTRNNSFNFFDCFLNNLSAYKKICQPHYTVNSITEHLENIHLN